MREKVAAMKLGQDKLLMRAASLSEEQRVVRVLLVLVLLFLTGGCGGGSDNRSSTLVGKKTGRGSAVFTLTWPAYQKSSRLIPAKANVIRIQISDLPNNGGTPYGTEDTVRPLTGTLTTTLRFNNLPPGQFYATAQAYPDYSPPQTTPNPSLGFGSAAPQASASLPLTIADDQTTAATLTMGTTITQLLPPTIAANSSQEIGRFRPFVFTPQARDKDGNIVLIAANSLQVSVSDNAIASVSGSGTVTINNTSKAGTVTVTVRETESGVSQSFSLAFAPAIYIVDSGNNQIVRMDDMNGTNLITFGSAGSGNGQFNNPQRIALDSQNRIYVADADNNRIVRLLNGPTALAYDSSYSGPFNHPTGVGVDSQNRIYVADRDNNRIVRINDMSGSGFISYGHLGNGTQEFDHPLAVTLDHADRIYIADSNNGRLVRIDYLSTMGENFTFPRIYFNRIVDIALNSSGSLVEASSDTNIVSYLPNFDNPPYFSNYYGNYQHPLDMPQGIATDAQDRIYICDTNNSRVIRIDGTDLINDNFHEYRGSLNHPIGIVVR